MKPKASAFEEKAKELVRHIDVVRAGAHRADKKNPATCTLLTMQEATVLGALAEAGDMPMSALAGAVNLSVSSATGLMDRLEKKALARRVRSGSDRRMVRAELTAAGRRLAELVLEGRLRMTRRMLSALSGREQDAFVSLFRKIADALSKEAVAAAAVLVLALVPAPRAAEVPAGRTLTLWEAFSAAKSQSEALAASQAGVEEAESRVRELWGAVQPNVTLQGSEFLQDSPGGGSGVQSTLNRPDRPEAKVSLTQPVFSGFREFLALKAARSRREASAGDLSRAASLLYRDVARAFHDLLAVQHELATRRATVVLTAERVKDLEARAKLGRSRASEVLQAKVLQSEAEAQLPEAVGRERTTQEVLAFLTGLPAPLTPVESQAAPAPSLEEALRRVRDRADVRARREDYDGAVFLERASRRERWPSASFSGNYYLKRIGFQEDIKWDVTFLASLPLYTGGGITARAAQAGSRVRAAALRLKGSQRLAESEVRRSLARLEAELERGKALAVAADLAEKNAKAQADDYKLGVVTNLDVLGALTSLQNVRLDLERSRLEASYLRAELEAAVGGPEGTK